MFKSDEKMGENYWERQIYAVNLHTKLINLKKF